jgi:putative transposase
MHRTLKAEATRPAQKNNGSQQQHFNSFRYGYNWLRPHKGLGLVPPAERLTPFRRSYEDMRGRELVYPPHFELRHVRETGELKIDGQRIFLSEVLAREFVGLEQVDEHRTEIYFGPLLLGHYDSRERRIIKNAVRAEK